MNDSAKKQQEHNSPLPNSGVFIARETQEDTEFIKRSQAVKRRWQNTEYRASVLTALNSPEIRAKAAKSRWQNTEYRKRTLAKLHNPEVKAKSSIARVKRFKEDPNIFKRGAKIMRERHLVRLRQLLGGDPKTVLEDLYYVRGLSTIDIGKRFQKDASTIQYWFKKLGISVDLYKPHKKTRQLQNLLKETRREAKIRRKEMISTHR